MEEALIALEVLAWPRDRPFVAFSVEEMHITSFEGLCLHLVRLFIYRTPMT